MTNSRNFLHPKEPAIRYDRRRIRPSNRKLKHGSARRYRATATGRFNNPRPFGRTSQGPDLLNTSRSNTFQIWWTHVWNGLVRDPTGKHFRSIGTAIWLYLYLLLTANWRTGRSFRRIRTIAAETSFSERNIQRWLRRLRDRGYIRTTSTGRFLNISITKWRPISRK